MLAALKDEIRLVVDEQRVAWEVADRYQPPPFAATDARLVATASPLVASGGTSFPQDERSSLAP